MPKEIDPITQRIMDLCGTTDKEIVLSKLRAVKEQKVSRLKHKKYRYFVPNGKGEEFIKKVGSGENFIILFLLPMALEKPLHRQTLSRISFGEKTAKIHILICRFSKIFHFQSEAGLFLTRQH